MKYYTFFIMLFVVFVGNIELAAKTKQKTIIPIYNSETKQVDYIPSDDGWLTLSTMAEYSSSNKESINYNMPNWFRYSDGKVFKNNLGHMPEHYPPTEAEKIGILPDSFMFSEVMYRNFPNLYIIKEHQGYITWFDVSKQKDMPQSPQTGLIKEYGISKPFINSNVKSEMSATRNIAVADFEAKGIPQNEASTVADFIRTDFVNTGNYNVMNRQNMNIILAEQKFQTTGCTEQEYVIKLGKLLNVKYIIVGSVSCLRNIYFVVVQVVDVETGEIVASSDGKSPTIEGLRYVSTQLVAELNK